jgi:hypothetical protein
MRCGRASQRFTLSVPLQLGGGKPPRLDAYLSAALPAGTSRARVAAAIRGGSLSVNGRPVTKPAQPVRAAPHALASRAPAPAGHG